MFITSVDRAESAYSTYYSMLVTAHYTFNNSNDFSVRASANDDIEHASTKLQRIRKSKYLTIDFITAESARIRAGGRPKELPMSTKRLKLG